MTRYDLIVIGAGIHGAGVAQSAAAMGHSVLVLEQSEPAAGTSGRSSKLIHGGLRYLESGQYKLVRESLAERASLLRLAPGLVALKPFHIPVYDHTTRPAWKIRLGLTLYALLGGLRPDARFETVPRPQWGSLDGLSTRGLRAVFRYYDGQTDDAALTRAILASAQALGADVSYPARFERAQATPEGYEVAYSQAGRGQQCSAAALVNAAGPWVDSVLARISPAPPRRPVELVRGSHILIDRAFEQGFYYIEAPRDRRAIFVMPWRGQGLIGTTESAYDGDPAAVDASPAEIEYLLSTFEAYFPGEKPRVAGHFAGLRVLPKAEGAYFHRPRGTYLPTDNAARPRLVSIYGGKLTGYRATATKVLGLLKPVLPARAARADPAQLALGQVSRQR